MSRRRRDYFAATQEVQVVRKQTSCLLPWVRFLAVVGTPFLLSVDKEMPLRQHKILPALRTGIPSSRIRCESYALRRPVGSGVRAAMCREDNRVWGAVDREDARTGGAARSRVVVESRGALLREGPWWGPGGAMSSHPVGAGRLPHPLH